MNFYNITCHPMSYTVNLIPTDVLISVCYYATNLEFLKLIGLDSDLFIPTLFLLAIAPERF